MNLLWAGECLLKSSTLPFISKSTKLDVEENLLFFFDFKPKEGAVLSEQTELKLSGSLLAADGGGNEKLMGKKNPLPTCLFSPLKPRRKTFRLRKQKILFAQGGIRLSGGGRWLEGWKKWFPTSSSPSDRRRAEGAAQ